MRLKGRSRPQGPPLFLWHVEDRKETVLGEGQHASNHRPMASAMRGQNQRTMPSSDAAQGQSFETKDHELEGWPGSTCSSINTRSGTKSTSSAGGRLRDFFYAPNMNEDRLDRRCATNAPPFYLS